MMKGGADRCRGKGSLSLPLGGSGHVHCSTKWAKLKL